MTESQFSGRVALVTGGSSGIGQATAVAFAREGATVVVADISADEGVATLSQIKELGGETAYVRADVTQASEVESLIKRIYEMYGRLDFAHNNAGSGNAEHGLASTAKTSEDAFDKMIALNIKGVFLCMKYELLAMLPARRGVIVNTASIAGMAGVPGNAVYSACKHAVVGLTKSAAVRIRLPWHSYQCLMPGNDQDASIRTATQPDRRGSVGGDAPDEPPRTRRGAGCRRDLLVLGRCLLRNWDPSPRRRRRGGTLRDWIIVRATRCFRTVAPGMKTMPPARRAWRTWLRFGVGRRARCAAVPEGASVAEISCRGLGGPNAPE